MSFYGVLKLGSLAMLCSFDNPNPLLSWSNFKSISYYLFFVIFCRLFLRSIQWISASGKRVIMIKLTNSFHLPVHVYYGWRQNVGREHRGPTQTVYLLWQKRGGSYYRNVLRWDQNKLIFSLNNVHCPCNCKTGFCVGHFLERIVERRHNISGKDAFILII